MPPVATQARFMAQHTSPQPLFATQAPVNRRILLAGVGGAAVIGLGAAGLIDRGNNGVQSGDGTGASVPTELPQTPVQQVVASPPAPAPTEAPDDGTIGFAENDEGTEPAADDTEDEASTPEASSSQASGEAVDPAGILEEVTVGQLRDYLDGGSFTIAALVEATLARIEEYDGGEIELNAVITLNPDAARIAEELDAELAAGQARGPLHGIPVLLKDIIATGDQMPNTAGSTAMAENIANVDSFVAARLREAGAVILGKTNLTEWSNYAGGYQTSGYSSLGGITVNPYNLNKSASGSSTGSAVAVAASYVPIAIGAEFDGSIIAPAAQCGVVGVKPTVGLVGRSGVIPIGFTRDSVGPMARTVTDAAIALEVIAGIDPDDPGRTVGTASAPWATFDTDPTPQPGEGDYTSGLTADALQGKTLGVAMGGFDDASQALFQEAIALLEQAGAEVIDASMSVDGPLDTYTNTSLPEFAWGLQAYLDTYTPDGPMATIQDIVTFGQENAEDALQDTDLSGLTDALGAISLDDPAYVDATATLVAGARTNGLDASFDNAGVDAFIAVTATVPVDLWDHQGFQSSSNMPSLAGYPAVTIPIGLVDDLPIGLSFYGRAFSEADLLAFAYALEQLLPPRAVPTYIPREG